jgi:hypothetical protein
MESKNISVAKILVQSRDGLILKFFKKSTGKKRVTSRG